MIKTMVAGIDPGLSGAIAILDLEPRFLFIVDMPTRIPMRASGKREVDAGALNNTIAWYADAIAVCGLEMAQVMPNKQGQGMGTVSSFNYGVGYGMIRGLLAANRVGYTLLPASAWKHKLGLSSSKDASREAAKRLFPWVADQFNLKKDDGRAEAALLAYVAHHINLKRNA